MGKKPAPPCDMVCSHQSLPSTPSLNPKCSPRKISKIFPQTFLTNPDSHQFQCLIPKKVKPGVCEEGISAIVTSQEIHAEEVAKMSKIAEACESDNQPKKKHAIPVMVDPGVITEKMFAHVTSQGINEHEAARKFKIADTFEPDKELKKKQLIPKKDLNGEEIAKNFEIAEKCELDRRRRNS